MKTNRRFLLAAIFGFALAFTFSCSSDDSGGNNNNNDPSGGGNGQGSCPNATTSSGILSCGGQEYRTVVINTQTWMAENLNYKASGSKCYDNKESYCDKYGRLYDWATAMSIDAKYNEAEWDGSDVKHQGICPSGWHIPSKAEWEELVSYVESNSECSNCAGKHLKAEIGWNDYDGESGNGLDTYRFSALPAGVRFNEDYFRSVDNLSHWWSASYYGHGAYNWRMIYSTEDVRWSTGTKTNLISVRCVQD
ncbi:MAG: hypothetical protein LBC87_10660 [Fibromonadaceae bacterium]|jgi:uncharacterized protein (TIGR02145 family)|nr:hypothetical protein [Fibromonadaceae bacterium]